MVSSGGKKKTGRLKSIEDKADKNALSEKQTSEAELEENTSHYDNEMDDQEDEILEDNAENHVDKDSIGKDKAIAETSEEGATEEDSEEVEYSEASMEEDDEEQEYTQKDELTKAFRKGTEAKAVGKDTEAKLVGKDTEEHTVQKVIISSKKMEKSSERGGKLKMEKSSESSGKLKKMEKSSERGGKLKMEKASENSGKIKMTEKPNEGSGKWKLAKSSERSGKKVQGQLPKKVGAGNRPEPSSKRRPKKRVEGMGMIFMCSAKTKGDCYQYKVLGLPESKKNIVEKIYAGMRLFLYDVDLKLLYGIYKAAGPGGFNIEPKAFKSQFPSQVRFTILDDCLPLAEEKFKKVIKENYFTKSKFDCQLNSEQVRKLCKLFLAKSKGKRSKMFIRQGKSEKHHPAHREGPGKQRAGIKRPQASKEDLSFHDRPCKRPRKVISSAVVPHRSPPAPLSPALGLYAYEKTTGVDAYRRDSYLESRSHYRERQDPIISRRDPYRDWRGVPPTEHDQYRGGRDINLGSRYHDKGKRIPYIGRRDLFRDAGNPYPERGDPYRDGRESFIDRHNSYRDERDPYLKIRDSYRGDERDSYLDRRGSYMNRMYSVPYSNDGRNPLAARDNVDREVQAVDYRNSYRREELSDLRLSLVTRRGNDVGSRDSYATYQKPSSSSYAEPVYTSGYPSRLATTASKYHL